MTSTVPDAAPAPASAPARTHPGFAAARKVADAVLYEGYVLYPYRASSAKNRMRWQFGVLTPPAWAEAASEPLHQRTEILLEPRGATTLHAELRFLHVQRRSVERLRVDGRHEPAESLELPDRVLTPWDETVEETVTLALDVQELCDGEATVLVRRNAAEDTETVHDEAGAPIGRLVRRRERLDAELQLRAAELPGPFRVLRLTAVLRNTSDWRPQERETRTEREEALPRSLVSAHLLLGVSAGGFVSMTDPPEWAADAVAACANAHTWPVLAGEEGRADVVLSSPIILEDHPRIAPESPGALYDGLEIDEILTLRTATLTEQEKREARGTDPRAAEVVELVDTMPPEVLDRLHGAIRSLRHATGEDRCKGDGDGASPGDADIDLLPDPFGPLGPERPATPWWDPGADASVDPSRDTALVEATPVRAGDRVVLRPGLRRTDAQDLFLHGRGATVEAVLHDVDGGTHVAVTIDGDPGTDIRRQQGRYWYFQPDELALPEDA
jgi:hypothetical protein